MMRSPTKKNKPQHPLANKPNHTDQTVHFNDNRAEATTQKKLNSFANQHTNNNRITQLQTASTNRNTQQPIQRKENKTGLPNNLKSGIENLSGYSMDDVKVHYNSSQPAQLKAHAFAQGTNIHLAPGQERHLPHEAWHVVQQKQGRVQPTRQLKSVNINDDHELEREADVMGDKALQMKSINHKERFSASLSNQTPVQLKLIVNGSDHTQLLANGTYNNLQEAVNTVYQRITSNANVTADAPLLARLVANQAAIKAQLSKWIENTPGAAGTHPLYGRKQQNRNYPDFYELALGLLGWVDSKPGRRQEKTIANDVYANAPLQVALNGLLVKLYHKIHNLESEGVVDAAKQRNIIRELTDGLSIATGDDGNRVPLGHYQKYHREKARQTGNPQIDHQIPQNQLEILRNPGAYSIKDKVIILHDLMEYFGRHQRWNPRTEGENLLPVETADETRVTTATDAAGERTHSLPMTDRASRGMGLTSSTRDERAPSTLFARQKGMPIWAGQSMTTVRMMKLAQWAGANNYENAALALSIFAYWRKDYDHTADFAYHTLFEVMDVAKNFGVQYKMLNNNRQLIPLIDLQRMLRNCLQKYRTLVRITQGLRARMAGLQIPPATLAQLNTALREIARIDGFTRRAYAIANNPLSTPQDSHTNLNRVVILLETAAQEHWKMNKIIATIPPPAAAAAPVAAAAAFDPDNFFA